VVLLWILVNFAAAVALAAVLLAVGARVRRLLRLPVAPGLRLPVDLSLGAWTGGSLLLVLGLLGLLRPWLLVATVICLGAFGRWRRVRRSWRPLVPAAAAGALWLPVALAPPFFYDALVYHLGLPWQALQEGALRAHPESVFAAFPPLAQLLALPSLALGLDRAPALLHLSSWLIAAVALHSLARRLGAPRPTAGAAAALLMILPACPLIPGMATAEGWLLAPLLVALQLALRPTRPGAPLAAGLFAGIAVSARLQGLPWAAIVLVLILGARPFQPRRLGMAVLGLLAGALPWWLKNLVLLHDPTAPLLWRREGLETLWRDAGTAVLQGASLVEIPARLAHALAPELPYLVPLALAAALALRRRAARPLAVACVLGLAAWSAGGALPRFLAPTVAVLVAMAAAAGSSRWSRWAAGLALAAAAVVGLGGAATLLHRLGLPHLIALPPGSARPAVPNDPAPAFVRAAELPADARLLFVGEPRGLGCPRPFVAPSQHDVSPLREPLEAADRPEAVRDWLSGRGYTHLLVNQLELGRLAGGYPVAPWRTAEGRRRWLQLLDLLGPPAIAANGVQVFTVQPPTRPLRQGYAFAWSGKGD